MAALAGAGLLLTLACGPTERAGTSSQTQGAPATGPKTIRLVEQFEYPYLVQYGRVPSSSPGPERFYVFHGNLTTFDITGNPIAHAAVKVPQVQDGDWKVNPDGTMEVTWKIRPEAYWQDGTPLTAEDFVFGYEMAMDPQLVVPGGRDTIVGISAIRALDPKTFVASWKAPYMYGNSNNHDGIPAVPKHLIEPLYRGMDSVGFEASLIWRGEFVGIGPYRITEWAAADHITGEAFDKFFLGRPKIDRVEIKLVADPTPGGPDTGQLH